MREIKFRAYEKVLKEIIPVYDIDFTKKMINVNSAWRTFDEVVLMQYTGIKDKNGREIYEGDIVRFEFGDDLSAAGPVKWRQEVSLWAVDIGMALNTIDPEDLWVPETYEVIGNIYEHPHLLEQMQYEQ